ncbi:UPF0182 family protein [Spirulina sp. CS-785/01]|uniref:UPF0182 family membrane protein n=1 Tax=Spirulina sp. CS-785/01 TaxID=3021716 RepID=UPI002330C62B|nr:UPF0182 family protein [Spirulina sp. CS-785/01]MDB9312133.1 UPF0182 family protein [Spirulina sp. CS-785/01]
MSNSPFSSQKGIQPKVFLYSLVFAIILLVALTPLVHTITEMWWFDSVEFSGVFWTLLIGRSLSWIGTFVVFGLFVWGNYSLAMSLTRYSPFRSVQLSKQDTTIPIKTLVKFLAIAATIFLAFVAASSTTEAWELVLRWWNGAEFGEIDPIYQQDIGFYLFQVPFYNGVRNWLLGLCVAGLIVILPIYGLKGYIDWNRGWQYALIRPAKGHISYLFAAMALLVGVGFWLQRYELLYSVEGVVFGAGYTDVHTRQFSLILMAVLSVVLTGLIAFSGRQSSLKVPLYGLGFYLIIALIFQGLIPSLEQQLVVSPNELVKEKPYIENNLKLTRQAYQLDDIENKPYPVKPNLTSDVFEKHKTTLQNIRLWDYRPLLSTYRQLQEIRLYYRFNDVDIDRYIIDGNYRQVMLSPRELAYDQVPERAQNWVNQRLKYTHGYGLVMSPVNRVTSQGLPELMIQDIPPKSTVDLQIDQPRIYYGEDTNHYVFTGMSTNEFDFPQGDDNANNRYDGVGGVPMPTFFHRLLYAYDLSNLKILISNYFTPDSKILYHRQIRDRIRRVAPFLRLDQDPYITLINGRLHWIVDAYTSSDRYPYSEPFSQNINYIRNSVKVLIDAYDGTMQFLVVDPDDPVLQTYQRIFPDLFSPGETIPDEVKAHFRYPQDFFMVQAQMYLSYHMDNPEVFYNQEDLWKLPTQLYEGNEEQVEPYYIIMQLPQAESEEFMLILPFTPVNKDNMVAWMAARSDGEHYGTSLLYEFPKQQLVYGPKQIEARIDQNPTISQQLTLWSQEGSRVIRGDLLVIPINTSLLYVEPVYLRAEQGELPELRRVIVAYDEQVVMRETLDQALATIFGEGSTTQETTEDTQPRETTPSPNNTLIQSALDTYQQAQEALQNGNWSQYGELTDQLEDILLRLNGETE